MRGRRKAVDIVVPSGKGGAAESGAPPDSLADALSEGTTEPSDLGDATIEDSIRLITQPGMGGVLTRTANTPKTAASQGSPDGVLRIGDMMVARGLITSQQLDYALAERVSTGLRLGSELVLLGM